jgi:hypothetical protein
VGAFADIKTVKPNILSSHTGVTAESQRMHQTLQYLSYRSIKTLPTVGQRYDHYPSWWLIGDCSVHDLAPATES